MNVQTRPSASTGCASTPLGATPVTAPLTLNSAPFGSAVLVRTPQNSHYKYLGPKPQFVVELLLKQMEDTHTLSSQILALEAATWMSVPEEMPRRAWTAPMRLESVFPKHLAVVRRARAGETHVNRVHLSTQVSEHAVV